MVEQVLAVRAEEYLQQVGAPPFIGLPKEEIERLHASVEVLVLDRATATLDATYLPIRTYSAIHYNYSWLTFVRGPKSLGIGDVVRAEAEAPAFLDRALEAIARREVERAVELQAPCEWRLAGLIRDGQLGLVYVGRLRQRAVAARNPARDRLQFCGNGELLFDRASFEPWSQLLIDNLQAF